MWHSTPTRGRRVERPPLPTSSWMRYRYSLYNMFGKPITALVGLIALCLTLVAATGTADKLQIGVKYKPDECPLKTRNGDRLSMQYVLHRSSLQQR
jgi:hypothetical protein